MFHKRSEESPDVLRKSIARMGRQASAAAQTGPKDYEDALHRIIDRDLEELGRRGELGDGKR
jgi:hypothetical protein